MFKKIAKSCFVLTLLFTHSLTSAAEIVVHPSTPLQNLDEGQLRAIFSLQMTRWADGSPIVVLRLSATDPTHKSFCKDKLKILPQQLEAVWERLVFTGQRARPLLMKNESEMMSAIASTPGAIGYIAGTQEHAVEIKMLPLRP